MHGKFFRKSVQNPPHNVPKSRSGRISVFSFSGRLWDALGRDLGRLGNVLGAYWRCLGACWEDVGSILECLGTSWGSLGAFGGVPGSSWGHLGAFKQHLGTSWDMLLLGTSKYRNFLSRCHFFCHVYGLTFFKQNDLKNRSWGVLGRLREQEFEYFGVPINNMPQDAPRCPSNAHDDPKAPPSHPEYAPQRPPKMSPRCLRDCP